MKYAMIYLALMVVMELGFASREIARVMKKEVVVRKSYKMQC
jgi:hypothetical protein